MATQTQQQAANYRVEVSGWDGLENFFLERTVLYWQDSGQQLCLRARLREGTVVFVRLVQPFESEDNFPIPYVVAKNLPLEMDGRASVAISRLHPTPSFRQALPTYKSSGIHLV